MQSVGVRFTTGYTEEHGGKLCIFLSCLHSFFFFAFFFSSLLSSFFFAFVFELFAALVFALPCAPLCTLW